MDGGTVFEFLGWYASKRWYQEGRGLETAIAGAVLCHFS
jgi:hypothetical protein